MPAAVRRALDGRPLPADSGDAGQTRESRNRLIALIAHELQHAPEVLAHPEVVDVDSMLPIYARIGVPPTGRTGYETSAAHAPQDAVFAGLQAKRR